MKIKSLIFIGLIFLFSAASCDSVFTTPINKILQNPRDYADKQVTISGTVVEAYSLIFIKYFALQDNTGKMIVVTQKPMPRKGDKIKVQGTVQDMFSIGDQQMIVLLEKIEN